MLPRTMALYTVLEPAALARLAAAFGLPAPDRVQPEPKGGVNSNYHLWAGGHRYFLRVNEGKGEADARFEAAVARYLAEAHFPVAELLPAASGEPFVQHEGKPVMLFAYAPGEEVAREAAGEVHCRRVGEQLGRLHDLAAGFTAERPNPYGPARLRGWLDALAPGPYDPTPSIEVATGLRLLLEELQGAAALPGAPSGLVHGDLFVDNVLWIGHRVSAVLDWEMSCVAPFAYDVGVALCAFCWRGRFETPLARALLEGYRSRRRVEPETLDALYAYTRYAALRFATSRLYTFSRTELPPERLPRKDWRTYRDRLLALRAGGEGGFRAVVGL